LFPCKQSQQKVGFVVSKNLLGTTRSVSLRRPIHRKQ
jgi:hypothetical protein